MIKIKNIFRSCWDWGKRHTFHFVIAIVVAIMGFVVITQQVRIHSLQNEINEVPSIVETSEARIKDWTNEKEQGLETKISSVFESVNARIDTVDSAIKPDKKRRMLISQIRDAITENTNHTIGVRDLNRMANAIIDYSYEFNLTIPQVLAQIKVESNFNIKAESGARAQGLMQIIPPTLKYIQHEMPNSPSKLTPWNIHHNIRAGCFYMSEQIETFGTYEEALRAYNWGPDRLAKFNAGEIKVEPEETLDYVPRVRKYIEVFSRYGLE
jgi:hypothetical protein